MDGSTAFRNMTTVSQRLAQPMVRDDCPSRGRFTIRRGFLPRPTAASASTCMGTDAPGGDARHAAARGAFDRLAQQRACPTKKWTLKTLRRRVATYFEVTLGNRHTQRQPMWPAKCVVVCAPFDGRCFHEDEHMNCTCCGRCREDIQIPSSLRAAVKHLNLCSH
jgi:hypothetical protein